MCLPPLSPPALLYPLLSSSSNTLLLHLHQVPRVTATECIVVEGGFNKEALMASDHLGVLSELSVIGASGGAS